MSGGWWRMAQKGEMERGQVKMQSWKNAASVTEGTEVKIAMLLE